MKVIGKTFCASVLAVALSAVAYAQPGGTAGGTATPGAGAGLTKAPNGKADGSRDVTSNGVGEARNSRPTAQSNRGKANGLNMGTRSGANSDVNAPRNGSGQNNQ
ncbi:hypothetical protein [Paraburkholderia kirstenboschensis]|uniref:Uncharacterized protein n=1 Tax=Paraburkholderia kirstenboschensis TaxID=1245436 RepID=A0ABZ0EVM2_9BURK|nr:hypothetical protein [Paraburkholderia kirstenboschensis]WOD20407.1 hypothetical protein RW095_29915 [Paraburkholderia kirstenboschensis]